MQVWELVINNLCMAVGFASGAGPEVSRELERRDECEVNKNKDKL